jgi:putative transposase
MGELILGERYLTVTFRFRADEGEAEGKIAWDCNEKSLDGFSPETGWIRIDLTKLFHIHRVYETKRERLQRKASKKPSLRKVLAKYSNRERNRAERLYPQADNLHSEEAQRLCSRLRMLR